MFLADYANTLKESTSTTVLVKSPTKPPSTSAQGSTVCSPQRTVISTSQGTPLSTPPRLTFGTPQGMSNSQGITISFPQGITKSPETPYGSSIFTTVVSPTSSERIITVTTPTSVQSIESVCPSILSSTPPKTTEVAVVDSPGLAVMNKKCEGVGSGVSSTPEKSSHPSVVTLDEGHEQKEDSLPPGIATLPRSPPTVPVQFIFQL